MMEEVGRTTLREATLFQKLHKSLSSAPIFSGPLAFLKLDSFFPLVHPVQGEPVEKRRVLIAAAHAHELPLRILVGLLEDRNNGPPDDPIKADP